MYLTKENKVNMIKLVVDKYISNIEIVSESSEAFGDASRLAKRNQINGIKMLADELILALANIEVSEEQ
tara:strand:+ start:552 stop:758 length:207 start_codon:yes stop_codon:yes gene_type:complete